MKQELKKILTTPIALISNLLLVYICFTLCRVLFVWINHSYFVDLTWSHLWELYRGGLVFDTSAIVYTNILYVLLFLLPFHLKENAKYQSILKIIYVTTNLLAVIMNLMDIVYFQYTNRRTTATIFQQFAGEDNLSGIIGVEMLNHWYLVLIAIAFGFALSKFYRKPSIAPLKNLVSYYTLSTCAFLVAIPLCIFGMRGGIGGDVRPITISNANQYVSRPIEAGIVLNTPFSIYRTMGKKPFIIPSYFSNKESLEGVFNPLRQLSDTIPFQDKNVVVLILESFSKEYIGTFNTEVDNGSYKGYTPFLDSLINESLVFEHSYGNGRGSIDAMPSTLSSIPQFIESFILTSSSLNEVSSISGELRKKGYYTAFFHGAHGGSMGFQAYARTSGYDNYFGREEYNNDDDYDGNWAIWDEEFLQFYAEKISTFKEPFSVGLFTATSHHPYNIPDRYRSTFPEGSLPIHKCIRYSDYALKRFFEEASKQPWFDNTLFVLVADHTNLTERSQYQTELGVFSIPIIFYTPNGDLKGRHDAVAQQIDIMPTVLGHLGYNEPYIAFGNDLLRTPLDQTFAVNYINGIYQYVKGEYLLQFDGEKTVAIYAFKSDVFLKNNLVGSVSDQEMMEEELKAIIQQYMERMNGNKLILKQL